MNLDHNFFQVSKLSEEQRKVFAKTGALFSPNSNGDLRSDAHQSQSIGWDADVDHTQIIGGDTVKLLGEYIPPSPPGFGTPARRTNYFSSRKRTYTPKRGGMVTLPKGYQRGSLGKSLQNGDYWKQTMRKNCLPTGIELAAIGLAVHCSTTWIREDVFSHA